MKVIFTIEDENRKETKKEITGDCYNDCLKSVNEYMEVEENKTDLEYFLIGREITDNTENIINVWQKHRAIVAGML